jgi:hypothetical protein
VVEGSLLQAARSLYGEPLIAADSARARLRRSPTVTSQLERASSLLREATLLAQEVRYHEALARLAPAERAALDGLARLLDARLLADIYLERGIAQLPTDAAAAQRSLAESLSLWPDRPLDRERTPPKILRALRMAQQASPGLATVSLGEVTRAARALGVRWVLVVAARHQATVEEATLTLYDHARHGWRGSVRASWDDSTSGARLRAELEPVLGRLLPRPQAVDRPPVTPARVKPRRVAHWIVGALGGAALVAGGALLGTAHSRQLDLEGLASQTPPVEYEPTGRELEEEGQRLSSAGIACLVIGAAAVTTAVVLWRLQSRSSERRASRVALAPGSVRLTLDLP